MIKPADPITSGIHLFLQSAAWGLWSLYPLSQENWVCWLWGLQSHRTLAKDMGGNSRMSGFQFEGLCAEHSAPTAAAFYFEGPGQSCLAFSTIPFCLLLPKVDCSCLSHQFLYGFLFLAVFQFSNRSLCKRIQVVICLYSSMILPNDHCTPCSVYQTLWSSHILSLAFVLSVGTAAGSTVLSL